jgi:hypothetical protein
MSVTVCRGQREEDDVGPATKTKMFMGHSWLFVHAIIHSLIAHLIGEGPDGMWNVEP